MEKKFLHIRNRLGSNHTAVGKMVLSMIIFGSIGFFSERSNLPALELVFVRCVCASIFLLFVWLLRGKHKQEKWERKEVMQTLLCGVCLVLNWVFLFKAFEETSITIAISVYHIAPILVLIIGSIVFKEKLTVVSVLSIIICFIGSIFISGVTKDSSLESIILSGVIWGAGAAVFYAFTTLLGKGIKNLSSYCITFLQTLLGVCMLMPFVDFSSFADLTAGNWVIVLMTGFIHTGIVYLLFFDSLRFLSAKVISILVFLDPFVAIILDIVFTGFRPDIVQTIGTIFIFLAILLTLIKDKEKEVIERI